MRSTILLKCILRAKSKIIHFTGVDIWYTILTLSDRLSEVSLLEPGDLLHFPDLYHLPFENIISMKLPAVQQDNKNRLS